jgi:hypothetical protein
MGGNGLSLWLLLSRNQAAFATSVGDSIQGFLLAQCIGSLPSCLPRRLFCSRLQVLLCSTKVNFSQGAYCFAKPFILRTCLSLLPPRDTGAAPAAR